MWDRMSELFSSGRCWSSLGLVFGFAVGVLLLTVGFWRTVFVVLCSLIGFFAGKFLHERSERDRRFY